MITGDDSYEEIKKPKSGYFISKKVLAVILLVFSAVLIGAVLLAYYVPSCEKTVTVVPTAEPVKMPVTEKPKEDDRGVWDGSLPETLKPSNYKVTIKPYLDEDDKEKQFTFDGKVVITFETLKSTDVIILHKHKTLTIDDKSITVTQITTNPRAISIKEIKITEVYEFFEIYLEEGGLTMGENYTIEIESFSGTLHHSDFQGLYLSNYTENGNETRHLAATQFETTNTRRAFPSFDEPDLKAYFEMTIIHNNKRVALCNMPVKQTSLYEGSEDWNITEFEITNVIMPTYLIAMVVADFEKVEDTTDTGVKMRVWGRPEDVDSLHYALKTGMKMLTYFENFWNIPYPLPKEDMVAVPDFYFGAMENWGLIIYRETALLYDPNYNSEFRKHSVAAIIAHELAHMWFGNLVTLKWWDHVWLNEGFASYNEYPALDDAEPSWDASNQYFLRNDLYRAFDYDDSWSSHPMVRTVGWDDDIWSQFDRIGYQKGASMNMMMETFLGADIYHTGVYNYLIKYSYDNAETTQLFAELTEAAKEEDLNIDVEVRMNPWVLQMGYPVITLTRTNTRDVSAEQQRFLMDPNEEPNDEYDTDYGYKWYVPLTFTDQSEMEFVDPKIEWMEMGPGAITLSSSVTQNDWYLVNINQRCYYRVQYEGENWDKLATYLKDEDHTTIHVRSRSAILDDAFSLAHAYLLDQVYSIRLLEYLYKETEYLPMNTAISRIWYTRDMLKRTSAYGYLEQQMKHAINNNYYERLWDFDHSDHLGYYIQVDSINTACYYGHSDCIQVATDQYTQWINNPTNDTIIHMNVAGTVYCTAIKHGSDDLWWTTQRIYKNNIVPEENGNLRNALACSSNPSTVQRLLICI
ncbi:aminopeptidase N-like [Saccoglossus kowalevskii]